MHALFSYTQKLIKTRQVFERNNKLRVVDKSGRQSTPGPRVVELQTINTGFDRRKMTKTQRRFLKIELPIFI